MESMLWGEMKNKNGIEMLHRQECTVFVYMQGSETPVERQALIAEQDVEFEKSLMIDSEKVGLGMKAHILGFRFFHSKYIFWLCLKPVIYFRCVSLQVLV